MDTKEIKDIMARLVARGLIILGLIVPLMYIIISVNKTWHNGIVDGRDFIGGIIIAIILIVAYKEKKKLEE